MTKQHRSSTSSDKARDQQSASGLVKFPTEVELPRAVGSLKRKQYVAQKVISEELPALDGVGGPNEMIEDEFIEEVFFSSSDESEGRGELQIYHDYYNTKELPSTKKYSDLDFETTSDYKLMSCINHITDRQGTEHCVAQCFSMRTLQWTIYNDIHVDHVIKNDALFSSESNADTFFYINKKLFLAICESVKEDEDKDKFQ